CGAPHQLPADRDHLRRTDPPGVGGQLLGHHPGVRSFVALSETKDRKSVEQGKGGDSGEPVYYISRTRSSCWERLPPTFLARFARAPSPLRCPPSLRCRFTAEKAPRPHPADRDHLRRTDPPGVGGQLLGHHPGVRSFVPLSETKGGRGQCRTRVLPLAHQVFLLGATAPYLPGSLRSRPLPPSGHSPAPLPLQGGEILKVKAAPGSIRCRPPVPPRRRASPRRRVPAPPG